MERLNSISLRQTSLVQYALVTFLRLAIALPSTLFGLALFASFNITYTAARLQLRTYYFV